jgi:hypothetical protein
MDVLLTVSFIVVTLFGIGFLIIPATLMSPFGISLDTIATIFARLFGSALLGYAFLLWFARNIKQAGFRKVVAYSLFTYYLVSLALIVIAQVNGLLNFWGWSLVLLHAILAVWFGFSVVRRRKR